MARQRLAYSVAEVAEMLGCSTWTVYRAIREGQLPTVSFVGQRRLIPAHGLAEYVAATAAQVDAS